MKPSSCTGHLIQKIDHHFTASLLSPHSKCIFPIRYALSACDVPIPPQELQQGEHDTKLSALLAAWNAMGDEGRPSYHTIQRK